MEEIMKYVKPELLMVAVVLYFIGIGLKQSQAVRDKYIPLILGGIGIVLCGMGLCILSDKHWTGNCNGSIYSNCTGNLDSRAKYICESDDQADREGKLKPLDTASAAVPTNRRAVLLILWFSNLNLVEDVLCQGKNFGKHLLWRITLSSAITRHGLLGWKRICWLI